MVKKLSLKEIRAKIADGTWVYDMPKGMSKVSRPEPLEHGKKLTLKDVRERVEYDGLGFCIFEFVPHTKIEDKELSKLWLKAKRAMDNIVTYLYGD
jgi:hypothetical protein